jgi:integrase
VKRDVGVERRLRRGRQPGARRFRSPLHRIEQRPELHRVRHLDGLSSTVRARQGTHLPVVLSMPEVAALLAAMQGTSRLMATLIYGGGLRVSECCQLRVKDIDFDQGLIFVRSGKGDKDRSTLLPETVRRRPLEFRF